MPGNGIKLGNQLDILDVERRILRACCTIRALPDPDRKFFDLRSLWPLYAREAEESYGYHDVIMPRFRPSPADVSDCLIALAWARGMERRDWRIVWWRSFGIGFRHIGMRIGRSDETARRRFKDAILWLWYQANHISTTSRGEGLSRCVAKSTNQIGSVRLGA